jgi:DMSO reductase family type II enzyme heme b subunit
MKAVEMNATGIERLSEQNASGQGLSSKAVFRYGRYSLVIKRKLTTPEQQVDVQFLPGQAVPVAFNVWNGTAGETGSQKAISSWFELVLE